MTTQTPQELSQAGKQAYQVKDYQTAAAHFRAAAAGFNAQGDMLNAAEAANNQSVALLQADDAQAALDALEGSEAAFEAAGDRRRQAMAIANHAAALEGLDRLAEAESDYQRSADILKELGEEEMRAEVMKSLSALQLRSGRQMEALASMQASVNASQRPNMRQRFLKRLLDIPFKLLNRG